MDFYRTILDLGVPRLAICLTERRDVLYQQVAAKGPEIEANSAGVRGMAGKCSRCSRGSAKP
jgi:hypothetical protein